MNVSFWEKKFLAKADIVVVGAGIVGLQCAQQLKLKYPKREIWVIDRAPLGRGASMRNAGFVCFGSVGEILDDISRMGEDRAIELYENRFQGVAHLLNDFGTTAVGYEATGGYEVFSETAQNADVVLQSTDRINQLVRDISGEDSFKITDSGKLGMKIFPKTIFAQKEGALQMHLLYKRILEKTRELGIQIYTGFDVEGISPGAAGTWNIRLKSGMYIDCRKLVMCTNGFTKQLLPDTELVPARGQILVTSDIPNLPWRGIFHADKGYVYFRSLGTRILIGGFRNTDFKTEETTEIENTDQIIGHIKAYLSTVVIPGVEFTVTEQWAGIMGMSDSRLPIVKESSPGLYLCVRMGGMGLALSAVASRKLAEKFTD